ncbi:hypothetical protein DSM25558_3919 [Agrobacterium sp. DSM 25558]|uniref:toll/interleukin-1 receptor domain-containing protein n=1 Tax=Agrobacterium sp. DSM 25558 TaxID=1907665 RepID=UPI00097265EE|nr:toll/interleukin-1 receptor domain-containing protein [Agrobacterium sp. DSM 25558]SCX26052.1 hypothetical protein DSM25558_3919 [Agrobacterium sp. DSM 25558]
MSYQWDVFLSYPRSQQVLPWIEKHFLPLLQGQLENLLDYEPKIFVDFAQATGVRWPNNIRDALLRSRVMVAIWTPPYFRSDWCMAEWESMLEREKYLYDSGVIQAKGLVYPVVFSDGKNFHPRAKDTMHKDLSHLNYRHDCFRDSPKYLEFDDAIRAIAEELEGHISAAPNWNSAFPIINPDDVGIMNTSIKLPRL